MPTKALPDSVRAVDRALSILLAFRPGDDDLPVAELLQRVDLNRPTLYRLVNTLVQRQFLISLGEPMRLRLGPAVAQLTHVWRATHNIANLAQPMMRRIREATQETVALFAREGLHRVCVAELESPQPLSFKRGVGYRERLALGASGRSILAHMAPDPGQLEPLYAGLPGDAASRKRELARIVSRGYANSRDELLQGAVAVAAPFFDGAQQVAGSICIFGPGVRIPAAKVEAYGRLLVDEAAALTQAMGQPRAGRVAG